MQTDEFVDRVHERLGNVDREQARRSTIVTLRVLGEALSADEAHDLAAQLPRELADTVRESAEQTTIYDHDTFLVRVAELAGIDDGSSEVHARAVVGVLREAVTGGEFVTMSLDLPDALDGLLAGGRDR
ncbi:MAG: DUF2267 domain-containing protein [Actinobacteria bacterium]|nr:DUF2267 domain-containing protein [Actinomycetota bacterium]